MLPKFACLYLTVFDSLILDGITSIPTDKITEVTYPTCVKMGYFEEKFDKIYEEPLEDYTAAESEAEAEEENR
jgi:hypothetical protein